MAETVSIASLIEQKDKITDKKRAEHDLTTSVGIITVQTPSTAIITEAFELGDDSGNEYLILNSVISPNLKDSKLQKAYDCTEPLDIVNKLFLPFEVRKIATKLMELAGNVDIEEVVRQEVKN